MTAAEEPRAASIALDHVSVFYGEVVGLSDLSLAIGAGITGIVGPNGSGKTTLMRVLTGLVSPREGSVRLLGADPFLSARARSRIGFVPATECFHEGLSARRNLEIAVGARGLDRRRAREAAARGLDLVGLGSEAHRLYRTWSRGMRQRLKLALALVADVDVVLLDEPFLGVDPPNRYQLRQHILALDDTGRTVLISSHLLHEIESITTEVAILAHGRLLGHGRVATLLARLRKQHPQHIRIRGLDVRRLGAALLAEATVASVELLGPDELELVTVEPDPVYARLPALVSETRTVVRHVGSADDSLEALFRHVTQAGVARL